MIAALFVQTGGDCTRSPCRWRKAGRMKSDLYLALIATIALLLLAAGVAVVWMPEVTEVVL